MLVPFENQLRRKLRKYSAPFVGSMSFSFGARGVLEKDLACCECNPVPYQIFIPKPTNTASYDGGIHRKVGCAGCSVP